jgi:hypothetical protein
VSIGKTFAPSVIAGLQLLTNTINGVTGALDYFNAKNEESAKNLSDRGLQTYGGFGGVGGFIPIENKKPSKSTPFTGGSLLPFNNMLNKNNPQSSGMSSSTTSNKTTNISQTIMVQGGTGTPAQQKQAGQNIANHTRVALQKGGVK